MTVNGGYDSGYEACPCFWGRTPGSLIGWIEEEISCWDHLRVLDLGCGEGKNAMHLARLGARVRAVDISSRAISNALTAWQDKDLVLWEVADVRGLEFPHDEYDVVLLYGLLHCFSSPQEINAILTRVKAATRAGGYHVVCAFNSRHQDLSAHPGFSPILLSHAFYLGLYNDWTTVYSTDQDLCEKHPHNGILHIHSMTRLVS